MSSRIQVVRAGRGPLVMLVHGSAADHTTWGIQLAAAPRGRFELLAYDRRTLATSVETHADDLIALAGDAGTPVLAVGSSFGAVVVLDAIRRAPAHFAGAVLIEPPMAPADDVAAVPPEHLATFERLVAEQGGEAAAEFFLRTVLSDATYARLPRAFAARSKAMWQAIRADTEALAAYRPGYAELARVRVPVLLLGGGASAPFYRPTLHALGAALPEARLVILPTAGHLLHAEARTSFGEQLEAFATEIGYLPAAPC